MKALPDQRKKAIDLRKQGMTYSEIIKLVPVAQSSISLWCRNVRLTAKQTKHIQHLRTEGIKRGAISRHNQATKLKQGIISKSASEISSISSRYPRLKPRHLMDFQTC